uniref:NEDD1 gamma-tubulin ring complex targeting factor n=1 Tax=Myotis myotis TaxID=51298 RepID=A0A7J7Z6Z9_MYOMY|nr:NEDD1 gamma-tubulin ring complex targeting factor [Myotis myotis]
MSLWDLPGKKKMNIVIRQLNLRKRIWENRNLKTPSNSLQS